MSCPLQTEDEIPPHKDLLSFLQHVSPDYLEALLEQYDADPSSLSEDWQFFFEVYRLGQDARPMADYTVSTSAESEVVDELRVLNMINAYRMRGHLVARVDPLGLRKPPFDPHLDLAYFKLDNVNPSRVFQASKELGLQPTTLSEIVRHLQETYCRHVGTEFHYIRDEKVFNWVKNRLDQNQNRPNFSADQKIRILKHLYRTSIFESFLQNNYTGQKRFSVEGAESIIPALKQAIMICAENGAAEVTIGMAHRGRLNVLANILKKPYQEIFKEFEGAELPDILEAMGDVKYHQGFSTEIETASKQQVHVTLAPNPSHLEFVNPVVEGMVRAKQETKYKGDLSKVVPILIHGDAAVIGQGIVPETLNLSQLEGYKTGGTIHIVINNQIGFTTLPEDSRSALYCTDHGKAFQCPIFHVNGDEVEDVVHAVSMAAEYRMKFNRDVFVDIWCYRKYGHNEGDEPRFTQPLMYQIIGRHPSPLDIYLERLAKEAQIDREVVDQFWKGFEKELADKRAEIQTSPKKLKADTLRGLWEGLTHGTEKGILDATDTRVKSEHLDRVLEVIHKVPENFKPLPKFIRMLEQRYQKIKEEDQFDWATGEQIAFGSLALEGHGIRLSGQDSIRGTFSQRHAAMTDNTNSERYFPLRHLSETQGKFQVYDSPLSEAGVLGFDYGYSCANPKVLTLWEAQFGDFVNGAQVIIDQFIASAESKWYRMSGLVLLLPHGYEGQGPEHSSSRFERFLQLCAQSNMQVVYPSTPAQYAHALRRQLHRDFRKPLIVITPKSMLRMPEVVSSRSDFEKGRFYNLIVETPPAEKPERVILCTGKIYWELRKRAQEAGLLEKFVFIRVEQLYPLDKTELQALWKKWSHVNWIWVQEEPKNMGAWTHMKMTTLDLGIDLKYAGRPSAASPATGSAGRHAKEQEAIIVDALGLKI